VTFYPLNVTFYPLNVTVYPLNVTVYPLNNSPARPGRFDALGAFHSENLLSVASFVWARKALNSGTRRFPARVDKRVDGWDDPRLLTLEVPSFPLPHYLIVWRRV
jgi:hypothetical protein